MRAPDTFSGFSFKEVRIVFTPYKAAGILIDRVVHIYIAQIWHCQQAWYIGIIHKEMISESIDFESVDCAVFGMIIGCILFQSRFHFLCQFATLCCQFGLLIDSL